MPKYHTQKYSNDDDQYQEFLDERDIEEIVQYSIRFFNQSIKTA